jgi:putative N6-adenine-specific DNA methylase
MTAPCHFGLEKTLGFELRRIGAYDVTASDGRVAFSGDGRVLAKANMSCSVAERVGVIIAEFDAPDFDAVFESVKSIPVGDYWESTAAFPVVKGQSVKSKLSSIPALQRTVKRALAEATIARYGSAPETGARYDVRFFLIRDRMTLFLDSSGEGLHKRGYRAESGGAPISETLAAGICDLAMVRSGDTVVDPLCGSGTILIEAALKALNIAPCVNRSFSAERWGFVPSAIWADARAELRSREHRDAEFRAVGSDADSNLVRLTLANARKAGVESSVTAQAAQLRDFRYPAPRCKVITNPPYAVRLNDDAYVANLFREMGAALRPLNGNELYVITPGEDFESRFGEKAAKNRKLYNGMIRCRLLSFK